MYILLLSDPDGETLLTNTVFSSSGSAVEWLNTSGNSIVAQHRTAFDPDLRVKDFKTHWRPKYRSFEIDALHQFLIVKMKKDE